VLTPLVTGILPGEARPGGLGRLVAAPGRIDPPDSLISALTLHVTLEMSTQVLSTTVPPQSLRLSHPGDRMSQFHIQAN